MVQHDVLQLEVRKLRSVLSGRSDDVFGLENRKLQLEMSMEERRREIEVHLYVSQCYSCVALVRVTGSHACHACVSCVFQGMVGGGGKREDVVCICVKCACVIAWQALQCVKC